jgi:hypothetical protein
MLPLPARVLDSIAMSTLCALALALKISSDATVLKDLHVLSVPESLSVLASLALVKVKASPRKDGMNLTVSSIIRTTVSGSTKYFKPLSTRDHPAALTSVMKVIDDVTTLAMKKAASLKSLLRRRGVETKAEKAATVTTGFTAPLSSSAILPHALSVSTAKAMIGGRTMHNHEGARAAAKVRAMIAGVE